MKSQFSIAIISLLSSFLLCISSCDDIVLKDLTNEKVTLLSPVDGFTTDIESQTFWWEALEGAEEYQIRIVTPSFNNLSQVIVNEMVTTTNYTTSLEPGTYQWRVRGLNSGSEGEEGDIYTITIASTASLDNQAVNIIAPSDNFETKDTSIQLLWNTLSNATLYRIQIGTPDLSNSAFIVFEDTTSSDNLTVQLTEGTYTWGIRAENAASFTNYSTQTITIDTTPPTAPVLQNYINSDTISTLNLPIDLSWTPSADAIQDTLYIYTDSALTTELLRLSTTDITYSFSDTSTMDYFWRVRSVDAVGNVSSFSETGHFVVQ